MRGAGDRRREQREAIVFAGWSARWIDLDVENRKKLGGFGHYRKKLLGEGAPAATGRRASPAELLATFESLRAAGVPMTIRRIA